MRGGKEYKDALVECVRGAAEILLRHFGRATGVRQKGNQNSVVSDADFAAEEFIISVIRDRFGNDSIIAEESGHQIGRSGRTWVIDPLDGTSNFVAGIPWFGAQVAVLEQGVPVAAAMSVPTEALIYLSQKGRGVTRNGKPVRVTPERRLVRTLCAFGFDANADEKSSRANAELLRRVSRGVRNLRATNSLVDFCYTLEGRLGGCVNLNTKIWDIAPVALMLPEAGGKLTDLQGHPVRFDLGEQAATRSYKVAGAPKQLHPQLLKLLRG
jgi:myo-inositol-1(or 4)-monophosphatase